MKSCRLLFILTLLIAVGCGSKESTTGESTKASTTASTASNSTETPSIATKNFLEAVRGRRYSEIRDMLSQRSITNLNEAARTNNTNVDQVLKRVIDQDAQGMAANNFNTFETRNEDLRGDNATVEAKATNAPQFARISLTREGNRWRINIDETTPVQ